MFNQVLLIVWRESVEAILIIGIVHAWLSQSGARVGLRYMWLGVLAGLGLAGLIGMALMSAASWLSGSAQGIFQTVMVLTACILIVQMVFWMRTHARTLKTELESGLAHSVGNAHYWGIATLVAIAVAREGSETVVFLYGMGMAQWYSGAMTPFLIAAASGFGLAVLTFQIMQLGNRLFSWRRFFAVTEVLLLLLAASLLVGGIERLIDLGVLPAGPDPLWDSSALLNDSEGLGGLLATFAGYRAMPPLTAVVGWVLYWGVIATLLRWQRRRIPMTVRHDTSNGMQAP
ncbi:FTR1 family iron permease [Kushneria phosphatilytica]|uniref:FTR1 family iron permease n=1 Tax=Kushneria phosphatilytica TaxID=657387 RepID=A0A1S1NT01_9GAMM|nr:FTR1 family protein [Kushneria phosphatilytica]OHV08422.1 FTR1 family iron permease [Kushneria phosphatilytica]QEL09848.1 FTR1 family iron permease [Kushneria phosphatilytica]